ncbi:threonylcarbamoyl-AMP synthase [bacterium]|nr:threonylcarbamoyl-AMP synthase [candidate division CSSED10-310 bacterium]
MGPKAGSPGFTPVIRSGSDAAMVIDVIRRGGVAVVPTETSYMLAADVTNRHAVERASALKIRPPGHSFTVAFWSRDGAARWTVWDDRAEKLARVFLPGPLTLILNIRPDAPVQFAARGRTLGIRIPGFDPLLHLLERTDIPVTATSANPHGGPEPYRIEDCVPGADIYWDMGVLAENRPSTIVDLTVRLPVIRREGSIPGEVIFGVLDEA